MLLPLYGSIVCEVQKDDSGKVCFKSIFQNSAQNIYINIKKSWCKNACN